MITITGDAFLNRPISPCDELDIDKLIVNMEYPIVTNLNEEIPAENKVNLKADGLYLKSIFDVKPYAVCLANNHILDYGESVALGTMNLLEQEEIKHFGFGSVENNYNNPCLIHEEKVSISAYCCKTTNPYTQDRLLNIPAPLDIKLVEEDLKNSPPDYKKVIIIHWGIEEYDIPTPNDIKLARAIINLGADLLVGHHAHVVQSNEVYLGKNIFYGLGNLYFPDLNVPRFFKNGVPSGYYIKKQAKRNKTSLIVNYNSSNNSIKASLLGFNNDGVFSRKVSGKIPSGKVITNESEFYKELKKLRIRNKIQNFIAQPKLPTIQRLKSLLRP
ncbi:CapA family protein [Vibrio fluvialis]|nr:CapA family protein [Vibrio fluvialis]